MCLQHDSPTEADTAPRTQIWHFQNKTQQTLPTSSNACCMPAACKGPHLGVPGQINAENYDDTVTPKLWCYWTFLCAHWFWQTWGTCQHNIHLCTNTFPKNNPEVLKRGNCMVLAKNNHQLLKYGQLPVLSMCCIPPNCRRSPPCSKFPPVQRSGYDGTSKSSKLDTLKDYTHNMWCAQMITLGMAQFGWPKKCSADVLW